MMNSRRPEGDRIQIDLDARLARWGGLLVAILVALGTTGAVASVVERARHRHAPCPNEVPLEYQYFLLGYACPDTACRIPLVDCHGAKPHRVKHDVLHMLLRNVHPDSIRAVIHSNCPKMASSVSPEHRHEILPGDGDSTQGVIEPAQLPRGGS